MKSSRQKRSKKIPWIRLGQIMLLSGVAVGCGLFIRQFRVQHIECHDQWGSCSTEVMAQLELLKGKSIFGVDIPTFLLQQPALVSYQLTTYHKILPHTLQLELTQSQTSYQLLMGSELFTVNQTGKLTQPLSVENQLPQLQVTNPELIDQIKNQSLVPADYHQALLLLAQFMSTQATTSQAEVLNPQTILLTLPDHPQFVLEPTAIDLQLARIKLLLNDSSHIPADAQQIDVRFKNPVAKPYKYTDIPIKTEIEILETTDQTASESSESSSTQTPEI